MNEQNNNFNPSMNNQPQQPTQPVRNKFFLQEMLNGNANNVGSMTSNMTNNSVGGQVVNWGTSNQGQSVPNMVSPDSMRSDKLFDFEEEEKLFDFGEEHQNVNSVSQIETLSENMLNDVNSTVYTQVQPEILDFDLGSQSDSGMHTDGMYQQGGGINQPNTPITPIVQPTNLNTDMLDDGTNYMNQRPIAGDILGQQPLSMNTLGNENVVPQDEFNDKQFADNSKYFDNNMVGKNFSELQANSEIQKQQMMQSIPTPTSHVPDSKEISMIAAYIGKKSQKIQMSPFSFCSFVFGGFYYMVRKMFLIGTVIYLLETAIWVFVPGTYKFIAFGFFRLVLALVFDTIYVKVVRKRVKKIDKNNPKRTLYDLSNMAKKKGGTSIILALLLNFLVSSITTAIIVLALGAQLLNELYEKIKPYLNGEQKVEEKALFTYNDVDLSTIMNYTIPEGFEVIDGKPKKYVAKTTLEGENNTCELILSVVDGQKNGEELIKAIIKDEGNNDNYKNSDTDGIEWYTLDTKDDKVSIHRRSALVDGKVVYFEYNSGINDPENVCDMYLVGILESISSKDKNTEKEE